MATGGAAGLAETLRALEGDGYAVVPGVLPVALRRRARAALLRARAAIEEELGTERLAPWRARGDQDIRLAYLYEPSLLELVALPEVVDLADAVFGEPATMRLCNGFAVSAGARSLIQNGWHMNFKRPMNGYVAAVEVLLALDDLTGRATPLQVAPRTQQRSKPLPVAELEAAARDVEVPAGGMLVMEGTLWHRERESGCDDERCFLGIEYVRPFVKPYFDHVRVLGEDVVREMPARLRRVLGWNARVPASLDEFYVPEEERLYRARG